MAGLMPKVFEEANLSGELKLSGRKLKDFPKTAAKFNLRDTVIADLSRNRLCELPEDVTGFPFLETLLMYHNSLRSIPESIRGLHSLSFLDLRSNLLTSLPRELCFLPIEVLLISNNRLTALPDELGRMEQLTELDAACNQITHLPARMSDLKNLKSLSLRNNQLVYLPRDVTGLKLVSLDISCNRIATLPVELRLMTDLVQLELSSNPLTSPPASLCVRGMVHVFKYLDTMALKEEKSRNGGSFDGHTTLRRNAAAKNSAGPLNELQKIRRQNVDSGYSTSDGYDKRWSQEIPINSNGSSTVTDNGNSSKSSPTQSQSLLNHDKSSPHSTTNYPQFQSQSSGSSTPTLSSPATTNNNNTVNQSIDEYIKSPVLVESSTPKRITSNGSNSNSNSNNNSNDVSPDTDLTRDCLKSGDKYKLGNIQTYREYKEALRQQRNQDAHAIYRPKESSSKEEKSPDSTQDSPPSQNSSIKSITSTPTSSHMQSNSSLNSTTSLSPRFAHNSSTSSIKYVGAATSNISNVSTISNGSNESINSNATSNGTTSISIKSPLRNEKPIQKVTPSRNSTPIKQFHPQVTSPTNGNLSIASKVTAKEYNAYVKPNSPAKPNTINCSNGSPIPNLNSTPKTNGSTKATTQKTPRNVSWNRDGPTEKLSFTMRREFDRQKEETELIEQLRTSIESRLKMTLPKDVGSALTDGVVLCHLANHVRPRSVGSIHVPSPAVPKLTMARCRRNVDNFLDACRRIGVDEELVCSCADIVPTDDVQTCESTTLDHEHAQQATNDSMALHGEKAEQPHGNHVDILSPPNPAAMFRTIAALLAIADSQSLCSTGNPNKQTHATNTNHTGMPCAGVDHIDEIDSYNQYFKRIGIHFQKSSNLLLDIQPEPCKAETNDTADADPNHQQLNEYSLNDDFDCSASNANVICDAHHLIAMQCSLCSSNASTNQQPNAQNLCIDTDELSNDCSSQNINSIKHSNSKSNGNNHIEPKICADEDQQMTIRRKTPNTLHLNLSNTKMMNTSTMGKISPKDVICTKKRKISNLKRSYKQMNNTKYSERFALNGITEECEYDSDIGKFNCKVGNVTVSDQILSDTSSGSYEFSEESATIRTNSASSNEDVSLNDLNLTPKQRNCETVQSNESFNINNSDKIVTKRIEFFENICGKQELEQEDEQGEENQENEQIQEQEPEIKVEQQLEQVEERAQNFELKTKPIENKPITDLNDVIGLISFMFAIVFMYFFPLIC